MHVGVLEMGRPPDELIGKYGPYAPMFQHYLGMEGATFTPFAIFEGEPVPSHNRCDAWVITGSKFSVYDNLPWIKPAEELIRNSLAVCKPVYGSCFGHQLMAQAMGGTVEQSKDGWGLGIHQYTLTPAGKDFFAIGQDTIKTVVAHRDQVVKPPVTGNLLASSAFCKYGAYRYGDYGLSLQGHPEYSPVYGCDLILHPRNSKNIPAPEMEKAMLSFRQMLPTDAPKLSPVIRHFLLQAA